MTSALARSFESGADAYEAFRPPYPDALFDDIREISGTSWQQRILDVGAGTGRATVELARRGARVDAVEPSNDMLGVLAERLDAEQLAHRVTVRKGTFEDVDPAGRYGGVVAAQSFHWTTRETRWSRLASLLGSAGRGFLFWNAWSLDDGHHDLDAITRVYTRHAPDLPPDLPRDLVSRMWADGEIDDDPGVRLDRRITYSWPHTMATADYLKLLDTISQYAVAPRDTRSRLYEALTPCLGDTVHLAGSTLLLVVAAE